MTVRIDSQQAIQETRDGQELQAQTLERQPAVDLFAANQFERVSQVRFSDGETLPIPSFTSEEQAIISRLGERLTEEGKIAVQGAVDDLTGAIKNEIANGSGTPISAESLSSGLTEQYNQSYEVYHAFSGHAARDEATQEWMFVSITGFENELTDFARRVEDKVVQGNETRADIAELQDIIASMPEDSTTTEFFEWTEVSFDTEGNMVKTQHQGNLTKAEAEQLLAKLELQLSSVRDATELQRFDLQQMTQNYQEAKNIISAMLKDQHDTRTAMIRNIK